jgi:hypothetical protein
MNAPSNGAPARARRLVEDLDGSLWVHEHLGADWVGAYRLKRDGRRVVVAELRIFPQGDAARDAGGEWSGEPGLVPAGGLTSRVLRAARVGDLFEGDEELRREAHEKLTEGKAERRRALAWPGTFSNEPRRPGRAKRSDLFLARVAARYALLVEEGVSEPIKQLTNDLAAKGAPFPAPTVRGLIHEARKRGLLEPAHRGRAGGDLTAKGWRILEEGLGEVLQKSVRKFGAAATER